MRVVTLAGEDDFEGWRSAARALAAAGVPPGDIAWQSGAAPDLFGDEAVLPTAAPAFPVPRAFIALALHTRYGGRMDDPAVYAAHALLTQEEVTDSVTLGLALRLAYTFCGGALSLLDAAALTKDGNRLTLQIAPEFADLSVEVVERRLETLATHMNITAEIMIAPLPRRLRSR